MQLAATLGRVLRLWSPSNLLTPHVKKHNLMKEVDISDFKKKTRLTKDVRNFLIQGSVVKIVKKDGIVNGGVVYCTDTFEAPGSWAVRFG